MSVLPDLRGLFPGGGACKRDRGPGLYVAPTRADTPYFTCVPLKRGFRLLPTPALLALVESRAPDPDRALLRSFSRFRGLEAEQESLLLFAEGAKLREAPEPTRLIRWQKALRRRAAACMRLGGGGGLYACALLEEELCVMIAEKEEIL